MSIFQVTLHYVTTWRISPHVANTTGSYLSKKLRGQHFYTHCIYYPPNRTGRALQELNFRGKDVWNYEFCQKWWLSIFQIFSSASEIFLLISIWREGFSEVFLLRHLVSEIYRLPVQNNLFKKTDLFKLGQLIVKTSLNQDFWSQAGMEEEEQTARDRRGKNS